MRLRPLCVVVSMFLLVPAAAQAHGHVWDVCFAPAWAEGSSLWGARVSLGVTNKVPASKNLSWVIDVANLKDSDRDIKQISQIGGPRWVLLDTTRQTFSVHALSGMVHTDRGTTSTTHIPVTVGGSYEVVPRGGTAGFGVRLQVERTFLPQKDAKDFWQISLGVVHLFD